jgi:pimeloyl-ACP methyl ester carboxylesterase
MEIYPPAIISKLQALLDAGDRDGVVTTFMGEIAQVRPNDLKLLKSLPAWEARVAAAHTIPRELRADRGYTFDARRFSGLKTPTLLIIGGDSPPFLKAGNEALQRVLPDCRTVVMPGQQHAAMDTGTELFLSEVQRFLV